MAHEFRAPATAVGVPEDTVRWTKTALGRLGYYTPDPKTGMTSREESRFKDAVAAFQMAMTITRSPDIGPGSLTRRILAREIARQDPNALYTWRTVGDGKVRQGHAVRNGQRFTWSRPPHGGNPGEDYSCRCWAEPLVPARHPWIDWAKAREEDRQKSAAVSDDPVLTQPGIDAINPALGPFDLLAAGALARAGGGAGLAAIRNILAAKKAIEGKAPQPSSPKLDPNDRVFKRPEGIPDDWIVKPTYKGVGRIYTSPKDKSGGTYVKVQKGNPKSSQAGQRNDNVRWQKNGKSLDKNGNHIKDQRSLESHISLEEFKFNPELFQ